MYRITGVLMFTFAASGPLPAFPRAADQPGSSDYPLVGRYEGPRITFYETKAYEELRLPFKSLERGKHDPSAWQVDLAGELTSIRYEGPSGKFGGFGGAFRVIEPRLDRIDGGQG